MGAFSQDVEDIARQVRDWFRPENKAELAAMGQRARALGKPEATFDIVRDLAGMIATAADKRAAAAAAPGAVAWA